MLFVRAIINLNIQSHMQGTIKMKISNTESLDEFCNRARSEFLLRNSESVIRKKIVGELLETSIFDISYWYGNGELIASNDFYSVTFGQDYNGFNYSWAILDSEVA